MNDASSIVFQVIGAMANSKTKDNSSPLATPIQGPFPVKSQLDPGGSILTRAANRRANM